MKSLQKQKAQKQIQITQMKQKLLKSSISNIRKLKNKQEQLCDDNKSLYRQIFTQIRNFEDEVQNTKQKIRNQFQLYKQLLQDDADRTNCQQQQIVKSQFIDINELGRYLQQEKLFLKNLLDNQNRLEESTTDKLHCLLNKKRFQDTLLTIKKKQLQQQIKFIETNILLSSGVSYDIKAPLQHQQKQLKSQIQRKIEQLDRVIGLSISCEGALTGDQGQIMKINELQKQRKRLQSIQTLLKQQNDKLNSFQSFLKQYPIKAKQIPNSLIGNPQNLEKTGKKPKKLEYFKQIELNQIYQLKGLNIQSIQEDLIVTLDRDLQVQQKINNLRKKIRKIQSWVR